MKYLSLAILIAFVIPVAYSQVTQPEAIQAGRNILSSKLALEAYELSFDAIEAIYTPSTNVALYSLNLKNEKGFIVLSGSKSMPPVFAYSNEGSFDFNALPDQLVHIVHSYMQTIDSLSENKIINKNNHIAWSKCLSLIPPKKRSVSVAPLITTKWGQAEFFNENCPPCATSPENNCLTGCTATAFAQFLNFYKYPDVGSGYNQVLYKGTNYAVDFSQATYNWDGMADEPDSLNPDIAKLMYHCGIAISTQYGCSGSNANIHAVERALKNVFDYTNVLVQYKDVYTDDEWLAVLKQEMLESRPVLLSASSRTGGHAFILDGFDDGGLFHINWGWTGNHDGWFNILGENMYYPLSQVAIIGATPSSAFRGLLDSGTEPLLCNAETSGTTIGKTNNVNSYGTSQFGMNGNESVFEIELANAGDLNIYFTADSANMKIFLLDDLQNMNVMASGGSIVVAHVPVPGTYYIVVDGKNGTDSDFRIKACCPEDKADLLFESNEVSSTIFIDRDFYIQSNIKNNGFRGSDEALVKYYYSDDAYYDVSDSLIGSDILAPIGPELDVFVENTFRLAPGLMPQSAYIITYIDADGIVDEYDENNNIMAHKISILNELVCESAEWPALDSVNRLNCGNTSFYGGYLKKLDNTKMLVDGYRFNFLAQLSHSGPIKYKIDYTYDDFTGNTYLGLVDADLVADYFVLETCDDNTLISGVSNFNDSLVDSLAGNRTYYMGFTFNYFEIQNAVEMGNGKYSPNYLNITVSVDFPDSCYKPVIISDGDLCEGKSSVLSVAPYYKSYQWYVDGALIYSATTSACPVNSNGSYSVEVESDFCSMRSNDLRVRPVFNPSVKILPTDTTVEVWDEDTLKLTAVIPDMQVSNTYFDWFVNGEGVSTGALIYESDSLKNGDIVQFRLITDDMCSLSDTVISDSIQIVVKPLLMQELLLNDGWNLVSFYILMPDSSLNAIVGDNPQIQIVKTSDEFYLRSNDSIFNTLDYFNNRDGYLFYSTGSSMVTVKGKPCVPTSIALKKGWNLIGCPAQLDVLIESVVDDMPSVVKDFDGFWEENGVNSIQYFKPGHGYFIKVDEDCIISF